MDTGKRARLEAQGWKFGSTADFLGLTPEDEHLIEMRLALSKLVRCLRVSSEISQSELAGRIGSSQSRVAKLEAADPGVSSDLMLKAAVSLGASPKVIGEWLSEYSILTPADIGARRSQRKPVAVDV